MLAGKKLLITGVINRESIAYEVARQAQEAGAEIVLTGFGRGERMTERAANKLPGRPTCSSSTSTSPTTSSAVADDAARALGPRRRRPARDRVRSRGRARRQLPGDAAGERRDGVPDQRLLVQGAGRRRSPTCTREEGASLVGPRLRRHGRLAGLRLDGRRQGGAGGGRATWRVTSGRAASASTSCRPARWARSPRAASRASATSPTPGGGRRRSAGTPRTPSPSPARSCFLLSDMARAITGEILHVDGGFHAMGTALDAACRKRRRA